MAFILPSDGIKGEIFLGKLSFHKDGLCSKRKRAIILTKDLAPSVLAFDLGPNNEN